MANHAWVPNEGKLSALRYIHFAYPIILLLVFLAAFMAHSISTAPKDATLEAATGLHGPGGKPLPKTKKRGPSAQREILKDDFSPAVKGLFCWLSVGLLLTFLASGAVVILHALAEQKTHWWCGPHVVVYVIGSLTVFILILLSLTDSAPSPTWAHAISWSTALSMEIMLLALSVVYFSGDHREPSADDRNPSKQEPKGYRHGPIRYRMTSWEGLGVAVDVARVVVLVALLAFWVYFNHIRANDLRARQAAEHDPEETSGLLDSHSCKTPNGYDYGSVHEIHLNGHAPEEEHCEEGWKRPDKAPARSWYEYLRGYSIFFPYLWPSKSRKLKAMVLLCFMLVIAQRVVNLLVPKQVGQIVDSFDRHPDQIPWTAIAVYIALRMLQGTSGLLGSIRNVLWIPVNQYSTREMSTAAFEHVHGLSLDFHLNKKTGEVISALNKGDAINAFLEGLTFNMLPMIIDMFLTVGYFLIEFDAYYALVMFITTISYLYLTVRLSQWRADKRREYVKYDREVAAVKNDSLVSYESVKYFNAEAREFRRHRDAIEKMQKAEYVLSFAQQSLNLIQNAVFTIAVTATCFIAAYQVTTGRQSIGNFTVLITFMAQLQAPLNSFANFYRTLQSAMINSERLLELFKEQPSVQDAPDAQELTECRGEIHANDIEFAYDSRNPALKGVTFRCAPGTTTALVGESGGGKSTMFRLLYRFYDLMGGNIEVDGHDIRNLTIDSLRRHIGVVPQDTILFNESIMYNLRYANPQASDEDVFAAARAASIHDKIMSFPDGYDSKVGERGLKLSGGEKQRVAIARTILKNPRIILLDEATSALDTTTEHQVQEALETLTQNRTTLVIAHRLSTITRADQILVLQNGRIAEAGPHDELMERNGRYANMWKKQMRAQRAAEEARYLQDKAKRLREEVDDSASASQSEDERSGPTTANLNVDKKGHRKQVSSLALTSRDTDSHDGDSDHHL